MRRLFHALAAFVLLASVFAAPGAHAEVIKQWDRDGWRIAALMRDDLPGFTNCTASMRVNANLEVIFGLTRTGAFSLSFAAEHLTLTPGTETPVKLTFDRLVSLETRAVALTDKVSTIILPPDGPVPNAFRVGKELVVAYPDDVAVIDLAGKGAIIDEVTRCVDAWLTAEKVQTLPPRGNAALPAFAPIPANAGMETVARKLASGLMTEGGMTDGRVRVPVEKPDSLKGRGVVWSTDSGTGVVGIMVTPSLLDAAARLVRDEHSACPVPLVAGGGVDVADGKLVLAVVAACNDPRGTKYTRYFIFHRAGIGYIVFAMPPTGAEMEPLLTSPLHSLAFVQIAGRLLNGI